jgi:hypothetical protein
MPHGVLPTVCAGRASPGLGADITEGSGRREGAAFSLALYINQTTDDEGNRRMKKATEELIDLTINAQGPVFPALSALLFTRSIAAVLSAD